MPVLDQSYRRWAGTPSSHLGRVLVIPRFDLLEIVAKRSWLLAWLFCLLPPVILGLAVYGAANIGKLSAFLPMIPPELKIPLPGPDQYQWCLALQCWLLVFFAVLVGPPLATRDFANGAMPLYLSKSLRRWDYVAGRCAVLAALLSLASWIPYLAVFLLECGLASAEWRSANWGLFGAIIAGTMPTVLLLTVLIVALGALVQRANLARAAMLFLLLGMKPMVAALDAAVDSPGVRVVSPTDVTARLREWAFEDEEAEEAVREIDTRGGRVEPAPAVMGAGLAFVALAAWVLGGLAMIARRVRPVEVVR